MAEGQHAKNKLKPNREKKRTQGQWAKIKIDRYLIEFKEIFTFYSSQAKK